jgi:hypothetical protein
LPFVLGHEPLKLDRARLYDTATFDIRVPALPWQAALRAATIALAARFDAP